MITSATEAAGPTTADCDTLHLLPREDILEATRLQVRFNRDIAVKAATARSAAVSLAASPGAAPARSSAADNSTKYGLNETLRCLGPTLLSHVMWP